MLHRSIDVLRPAAAAVTAVLWAAACTPADPAPVAEPAPEPTARTAENPANTEDSDAARSVRAARASFNAALAAGDLETIRALHAPEYHLITGRSAQFHGTEAHLALWQQSFAQEPPDLYVRTTREVRVNDAYGLAEELGDWKGAFTGADGSRAEASGVYAAKWQRAESTGAGATGEAVSPGDWRLQSEVYTTLSCTGSADACRPPDAIPADSSADPDES